MFGCGPTGQLAFITPRMPLARDRPLPQDTGHLLVPDPAKSMDLRGFTVRVRVTVTVVTVASRPDGPASPLLPQEACGCVVLLRSLKACFLGALFDLAARILINSFSCQVN